MGYDVKHGQVSTERGAIGDDEPVVVFRAQDKHLPAVLEHYRELCVSGSCGQEHTAVIDSARGQVQAWQSAHQSQVKLPDTTFEQLRQALPPRPGG